MAQVRSLVRELRSCKLCGVWCVVVFKINDIGNFLLVQWLRLCIPSAGAQIQFLVRELAGWHH